MAYGQTPLQAFLTPRSIVVFGDATTEESRARALLHNLVDSGFGLRLAVVADRDPQIAGVPWLPSLEQASNSFSLALIDVDAPRAIDAVIACGKRRVPAAILYSRGFKTDDPASAHDLQRLVAAAAEYRVRLFGPHAFGIILPHAGLNLTPARIAVSPGNLALVSQSASVCGNILDWSHGDGCGLSGAYVLGVAADIGLAEVLDHLATDPKTECILLYLEGVAEARRFFSAVRAAASVKPVIALKTGKTMRSARIAEVHNGLRAGGDAAFDAALRRAGVLRVRSVGDMFSAARALTTRTMPRGARLAIVTNGGGPAVMAVDEIDRLQIDLAAFSEETEHRLSEMPRAEWSRGNPVAIRYDADAQRYVAATQACLDDPGVDGVLVILAPNDRVDPLAVAQAMIAAHGKAAKPVLACWLGENRVRPARQAFAEARFPAFRTPENAILAFSYMATFMRNQALLRETPAALSSYVAPNRAAACAVIERALESGREGLALRETKAVLEAFQIPVSPTRTATTPTEAIQAAQEIGYPVTMKAEIAEPWATPGSGKVRRHLRSAPEVAMAWRELATQSAVPRILLEPFIDKPRGRWLAIGIQHDALLGPVISLSESGIAAEVYDARALALPPLNKRLIEEMLGVPHVARLLGPLRDLPAVAQEPLREMLLRVSELASELPWIQRLDISALVVDDREALVVDASIRLRAALHDPTRYCHMAICPYPQQLVQVLSLKDGSEIALRPVRPEDASALQDFVRGLSVQSKRLRYFSTLAELPQHALARATQIDYGRQLTLLAVREDASSVTVLGEAQYTALPDGKTCDFAIVVADEMAGKGLGKRLMQALADAARKQGLSVVRGDVAAENEGMLGLMESLGFTVQLTDDPETVEVVLRM